MGHILDKLGVLQKETKQWKKRQRWHMNKELASITKEPLEIRPHLLDHSLPDEIRSCIHVLESQRQELLHIKEITWRLKITAIWIWDGDWNTKFFHRYVNYRR